MLLPLLVMVTVRSGVWRFVEAAVVGGEVVTTTMGELSVLLVLLTLGSNLLPLDVIIFIAKKIQAKQLDNLVCTRYY